MTHKDANLRTSLYFSYTDLYCRMAGGGYVLGTCASLDQVGKPPLLSEKLPKDAALEQGQEDEAKLLAMMRRLHSK